MCLFRIQFALVYFGAALNKLFEPDWWSGRFFQNWMENRLNSPFLSDIAHATNPHLVYSATGLLAIATEATMVILFLVPRFYRRALWIGVAFHFSTTVFTGGSIFGFFVPVLVIAFQIFDTRSFIASRPRLPDWRLTQIQNTLKSNVFTHWTLFALFWLIHNYSPHTFIVQTLSFAVCYAALFPYEDLLAWVKEKLPRTHETPVLQSREVLH